MDSKHKLSGTRQICLYMVVSFAYILWGICGSLLPPFFPDEAKSKGASLSQSGFVFGLYNLAGFISSLSLESMLVSSAQDSYISQAHLQWLPAL